MDEKKEKKVEYPVKNVTRIFSCLFNGSLVKNETQSDGNPIIFLANVMEIPCHFMSQIDGSLSSNLTTNSVTIPCHLSSFYLFSMLEHDMDFGQVQVMEFHRICYENDGISIGFGLIFDQTAVKKT